MKNLLSKLIPLTFFSVFALNSIDSKAQDFLPGKFKNYNAKKILINYDCIVFDEFHFLDVFIYDIDKDSMPDVIEISPSMVKGDSVQTSKYPVAYSLLFENGKRPKFFYDCKMDGWNQNEEIISNKEISKDINL